MIAALGFNPSSSHFRATSSSGALVTPTENSTKPLTTRVTHAGIAIVNQFNLRLP
jgi:hypothetical protein